MNENELLFSFLIGLIVVSIAAIILSAQQWRQVEKHARISKRMRMLSKKNQPTVTVLVYAYNQQDSIVRFLREIKRSYYHAFDIIVVDDASTDDTNTLIKEYMSKYPKVPIRLLRRRKHTSEQQALQAGYRKSQRGSIVIPLNTDMYIDTFFIKRAVACRTPYGAWQVTIQQRLSKNFGIADVSTYLSMYMWQANQRTVAYDSSVFLRTKQRNTKGGHLSSLPDVIHVFGLAVLLLVMIPLMGNQLLWYSWIILTAYGIVAIWLRYSEPLRDRLILTLSLPIALFLLPVTSAMRGISQVVSRK